MGGFRLGTQYLQLSWQVSKTLTRKVIELFADIKRPRDGPDVEQKNGSVTGV